MIDNLNAAWLRYQMTLRQFLLFVAVAFCLPLFASAQKPFTEGTLQYIVKMGPIDPGMPEGAFTISVKGPLLKKEMKLNGMEYVLLIDGTSGKVYSLQNNDGKKIAIELRMEELLRAQEKFKGFSIETERNENRQMAGCHVISANVRYKDGATTPVSYTKEWKPSQPIIFDRFPGAEFLPLDFFYKDESGLTMSFEAEKVTPGPVENAIFRLPPDYKIISYKEYKELSK